MNMQKVVGVLALILVGGVGLWLTVMRESGPDAISQEIAENLIFAQRDGVVYYENDEPRSWNAAIEWSNGEIFQVSYIDEMIADNGETRRWVEMNYIYSFPDMGQVMVGDADMDGQVDSLSINGAMAFHTEPGYEDVNPQLREEAQRVLEVFRAAALALAQAPDGDIRDLVAPPGVPL